ncbi:MAG: hypothetical protein KBS94_06800 [Prevotella sp.]|nr:hypothetical protein [Candidatus Equicola faecalis]
MVKDIMAMSVSEFIEEITLNPREYATNKLALYNWAEQQTGGFDKEKCKLLLEEITNIIYEIKRDRHRKAFIKIADLGQKAYRFDTEALGILCCFCNETARDIVGMDKETRWGYITELVHKADNKCSQNRDEALGYFYGEDKSGFLIDTLKEHIPETNGNGGRTASPSILDTPEAQKIFNKAIEARLMERGGDSYKWNRTKVLLAYLIGRLLGDKSKQGEWGIEWVQDKRVPFPDVEAKRLFGVIKLSDQRRPNRPAPRGYETIDLLF